MTNTRRSFTRRFAGLIAAVVAAVALAAVAAVTNQPAASQRCLNTPVGCITEQQNLYLHHHPVLIGPIKLTAKSGRVPSKFQNWGYFCAYAAGPGAGYGCINNWNGGGQNNLISFYNEPSGGPDGQWNQWYYGYVDSTFPWGTAYNLYTHYQGNGVYQYCWAPNGNGSGLCLDQGYGAGYRVRLWPSITNLDNGDPQFWVWDGNNRWVAVYATVSSYMFRTTIYYAGYVNDVNNGSPLVMEPISHSIEWSYVSP